MCQKFRGEAGGRKEKERREERKEGKGVRGEEGGGRREGGT